MTTTYSFQAGGRNPHYGRIAHWLAGHLWQALSDVAIDIKVGDAYRDLRAVGDGLAQIGISTPAAAARLCLDGQAHFERPRPALRAIGVVPHRDALVLGAVSELGLTSIDQIRERRVPLRLALPEAHEMTGHASRHVLDAHGLGQAELESWGGQYVVTENAQACWKLVAAGGADAMINESIPQSWRPLAKTRPIRLLSMRRDAADELQAEIGYRWRPIVAGTIQGQDEDVIGLSWDHWIVVAHEGLPDEVAHALADAWITDAHHLERQYTADNRLKEDERSLEYPMRPEVAASEVTIPLHRGAAQRFREAGVLH
jgi:TRAP-type uncharacterized transport system substrate-binding protein